MKGPRNAVIAQKKPSSKMMLKTRKGGSDKVIKKNMKDTDAPKRPPTAFFVFMEEFRKLFKEKHPDNKAVSVVGKAGGEKWKSLSDSEKAPYAEKALKRKAEYEKDVEAYKQKKFNIDNNGGNEKCEEESEKSSSEVHNDDEQEASS